MSGKDLSNTSRTNWAALEAMTDEEIDYSDIPPLMDEFFENATPNNSLICIGDGDNIGDVIDFHLLSGNLEEASKFSSEVKAALEDIATLAKSEIKASLIYVAGDDICFIVSANLNISDILTSYAEFFLKKTGKTMSFGIGRTSVEALICLRKAKVSGKGLVITSGGNQK